MYGEIEVVPFGPEHNKDAAILLAEEHARERRAIPELQANFEEPGAVLPLFEDRDRADGPALAATRHGELVGFLLGRAGQETTPLGVAARRWSASRSGHAAAGPDRFAIYHALYAAMSESVVRLGCFTHNIIVRASDEAALDIWFNLGFGLTNAFGLREVAPIHGGIEDLEIRRASRDDLDECLNQGLSLILYHAAGPMLTPAKWNREAMRQRYSSQIDDPAYSCWLAYLDDEVVGMMTFGLPTQPQPILSPAGRAVLFEAFLREDSRLSGIGTALLRAGFQWLEKEGYRYCTVGWATANALAVRFWASKGFRLNYYMLERRLDPDISWAHARQSRDDLWRRW